MPSDVIQNLQSRAVFVLHPRKEQIDRVAGHAVLPEQLVVVIPRLRKAFVGPEADVVVGRVLVEVIERAVRTFVVWIGVWIEGQTISSGITVLHQMIPARKNNTPEAVHERVEVAARRMIELKQIA